MLRDVEHEKEILLGNKQLLGIFFLVVILLGVAFGSGYKVGQGHKSSSVSTGQDTSTAATSSNAGGETRTIPAENSGTGASDTAVSQTATEHAAEVAPPANSGTESSTEPTLLGGRRKKKEPLSAAEDSEAPGPASAPVTSHGLYAPQAGQTFLQVAAVSKDEAEGIADVLRRKGFHAHSVPKPGSKLYRVIIGPVRDASDLSSTRNLLHSTGFREVFVQRY